MCWCGTSGLRDVFVSKHLRSFLDSLFNWLCVRVLGAAPAGYATDFNQTPRSISAPTIGAYEYTSAANPGWPLQKGTYAITRKSFRETNEDSVRRCFSSC